METQQAVILAAGNGKRMGCLTADRPKALLDVDGQPLIERALDALASFGVSDVSIVVGYQQQRLRDRLGSRVRFIENERYRETNSLYSLWLAREQMRHGAVIMNSDILVSRELLGRLIGASAQDAVLIDTSSALADEEMKVRTWHGFVVDFGKDLPPSEAHGENVGILKFGAEGGSRLVGHLDRLIAAGQLNAWAPMAFRAVAREWPLRAIETDGLPWTEIDFPADLERARQIVAPAIVRQSQRGRS
jgi:L-glutamine-phosphate cytidylyltransferase